jgi:uncharacterized membrane protein YidH (DUF202 family)
MNLIYFYVGLFAICVLALTLCHWAKKTWIEKQPDKLVANYRFNKGAILAVVCFYFLIVAITLFQLAFPNSSLHPSSPSHPFVRISMASLVVITLLISLREQKRNLK